MKRTRHPMDKDYLQLAAKAVERHLPDNHGFILLVAPYGEAGRTGYVSSCDREDALKLLKEWFTRCGQENTWLQHLEDKPPTFTHRGYEGTIITNEPGNLYGRVKNTAAVIDFAGTTLEEAEQAFKDSVDDYLAFMADEQIYQKAINFIQTPIKGGVLGDYSIYPEGITEGEFNQREIKSLIAQGVLGREIPSGFGLSTWPFTEQFKKDRKPKDAI